MAVFTKLKPFCRLPVNVDSVRYLVWTKCNQYMQSVYWESYIRTVCSSSGKVQPRMQVWFLETAQISTEPNQSECSIVSMSTGVSTLWTCHSNLFVFTPPIRNHAVCQETKEVDRQPEDRALRTLSSVLWTAPSWKHIPHRVWDVCCG